MARFNTGNPVGSKDPRDLSDNAQNIDEWSNGSGASFSDRLGVQRRTIAGMTDEFQSFLDGSAYDFLGDYAADIEVTSRNQVIREAGEFWRISAGTELPYTTTGAGMPEGGAFAAVGDAVLRQDLAGANGLDLIGGTGTAATRDVGTSPTQVPDNDAINSRGFAESVASVADLRANSFPEGLERLWLSGYYGQGTPGGGYLFESSGVDDGGQYFADADGRVWERSEKLITPAQFGAQSQNDARHEAWKSWAAGKFNSLYNYLTLTSNRVVKVPTDYPDLIDAINAERHWIPNGKRVRIELELGYELPETVELVDEVLPHMEIAKPDGSDLTLTSTFAGDQVFIFRGCWAPFLNFKIDCAGLNAGAAVRYIASRGRIAAGGGAVNSGWRGLYVTTSSSVDAEDTIWDGAADDGIRASNSASIQARSVSAKNCGGSGLSVAGASSVNASGAPDFSGCGNNGIYAQNNSTVYTWTANCSGCTSNGIEADKCSTVDAEFVDTRGCGSNGLLARSGAIISTNEATISDQASPSEGVRAVGGKVIATNSTITHSSGRGAQAQQKGELVLQGSTVTDSTAQDLVVFHGSTMNIHSGTFGDHNVTLNTLTNNGIIFTD